MEVTEIFKLATSDYTFAHSVIKNPQDTNARFQLHSHDFCEIIVILRGDITYSVEGRVYKLKRGDIVYSKPSIFHRIHANSNETYERYNIIFDEKRIPEGILSRIPKDIDVFRLVDYEMILEILERIEAFSEHFSDEEMLHISKALTEEIFFNLAIAERKTKNATVNPLVDKAISYIHDNLTTITDIAEICDALYITKSHLHHIFVKTMQMSPKQYIISKRLAMARKMIRRGEKPTEVSAICGFGDYTTFFRNYKKAYGYSPSEEVDYDMTAELVVMHP